MKDYLSRLIEYSGMLKEIEIAGEEHLKIIKQNSHNYLRKAEILKEKISSDIFLTLEDKERMLKKISNYMKQVKSEDDVDLNSFLLGIILAQLVKEGIISEIIEKLENF